MPPDDLKAEKSTATVRMQVHASKAAAQAQVATINTALGYPRTERGIRRGAPGSVWPESITTTSECEPLELDDGTWGVRAVSLERANIDATGARDVKPKVRT